MSDTAQPNRLPAGGAIEGLIDRSRPLAFTFDGNSYTGYAGDTLASALIAASVKLVGRSFKYHRPRGIFSAGPEEPNALVELRNGARREPNTRATTVELYDGLEAASQNRWPSLAFDILAINQIASPLFVGGSLEAEVDLHLDAASAARVAGCRDELRFFFITSEVRVHELAAAPAEAIAGSFGAANVKLVVTPTAAAKCVRCWHHRDDVGKNAEHPELCGRCVTNVAGEGERRDWF